MIIFGYGYDSGIPAMERVDRKGIDGTNIHVHNYFVNILARGGLIHLSLMILFYIFLISKLINLKNRNNVVAFIFAALFVSFLILLWKLLGFLSCFIQFCHIN